jgi:hypothetical protein
VIRPASSSPPPPTSPDFHRADILRLRRVRLRRGSSGRRIEPARSTRALKRPDRGVPYTIWRGIPAMPSCSCLVIIRPGRLRC